MKYEKVVLNHVLSKEKWKSTSKIKQETEKKARKSINWYTIHYLLEKLLEKEKVEKINSENVTLWRKIVHK